MPSNSINRRDFMRRSVFTGIAAAAAAGPSIALPLDDTAAGVPQSGVVEADVVVVGGGLSGVCAAVASARNGAQTVLIQDRPVLGGNSSSEIRMHVLGADYAGVEDWRETGILEQIRLENQVRNVQRSPSMWDLVIWEAVRFQPGLTLLLNTVMTSCVCERNVIREIECYRLRTERTVTIRGRVFVDCTGDATLGWLAGAPYRVGREGRDEFGEEHAPAQPEPHTMGNSLLFTARDMGRPAPFVPPAWAHRYDSDDQINRHHSELDYGYWWIEWGGMLDTISDDDRIRDELLRILFGIWDHVKNRGDHGAENWALEWFGALPGRRESRRLEGDYILREQDLLSGRVFEDEVAYGGWPLDDHHSGGFDRRPDDFYKSFPVGRLYSIPLRCLYSKAVRNLYCAGRNVSTSHVAFSSTRVMATCALMGQGAGTAAARGAIRGIDAREFSADDIRAIKQDLLRDDAYLPGTSNEDPDDFARTCRVRAGSEQTGFEARMVISGVARARDGVSNQWRSLSLAPDDAWLELDFGKARPLGRLHLAFDTGLSRQMTLTQQDSVSERMVSGPQPETVRAYRVEARVGGAWKQVAAAEDNYQRKVVHSFEGLACDSLRLRVDSTHGADEARLYEVRCYS